MPYVASTMSGGVTYAEYASPENEKHAGPREIKRTVVIKGGAGIANRKHALAEGVLTPDGVVTKITDDDLEFLMRNKIFLKHLKGEFVKVLKFDTNPTKAASDMNKKDPGRPLTPEDSKEGGRIAGAKLKTDKEAFAS